MKKVKKILKHLFVPHRGNAFRPHAFRHKALSIYALAIIVSQLVFGVGGFSSPIISTADAKVLKENIIAATNARREQSGATELTENSTLDLAAEAKLNDMFSKSYWDHTGPNGETAWSFISENGYEYQTAGENLAKGFTNSEEVVTAWMNSPTHRKNLLDTNFKEIGIAAGSGKINGVDTTLIVQLFGTPKVLASSPQPGKTVVLGSTKLMPQLSFSSLASKSKLPFALTWVVLLGLVGVDALMVRRLGLFASKSHSFNFKAASVLVFFGVIVLAFGVVGIA